jgi:hypothetical protein
MKTMLTTFFDIRGIVHFGFISQGQTVNQSYYVEILKRLRKDVCRMRPDLWLNDWILHHDNAPPHKALSSSFWPQKSITEMENQPYSPHLGPNDYCLFPKINSALKGRTFQDTKGIKKMTALKAVPQ